MSYDLGFWKYKPGISLDHQTVYERLSEGQQVDGLEDLPIEQMNARIGEVFSNWQKLDEVTFDGADKGTFQLYTTSQFLRVDCYGVAGEDMNRFIEIAAEFSCPLYDPQVGKRFEGG